MLAATGPASAAYQGLPRVLLPLLTPRRYHQPDYLRRIAGRVYGGDARRDPDGVLRRSVTPLEPPSAWGYLGQLYAISG